MSDPRPSPLSEHHDADWGYGTRRYCVQCWSSALRWAPLASAVVLADLPEQRRAFGHELERGQAAIRPAWWCPECAGCGMEGAPALLP